MPVFTWGLSHGWDWCVTGVLWTGSSKARRQSGQNVDQVKKKKTKKLSPEARFPK